MADPIKYLDDRAPSIIPDFQEDESLVKAANSLVEYISGTEVDPNLRKEIAYRTFSVYTQDKTFKILSMNDLLSFNNGIIVKIADRFNVDPVNLVLEASIQLAEKINGEPTPLIGEPKDKDSYLKKLNEWLDSFENN